MELHEVKVAKAGARHSKAERGIYETIKLYIIRAFVSPCGSCLLLKY